MSATAERPVRTRPAGPAGHPWVLLARYLRDPLDVMDRCRAYGDVAHVRFPGNHDFYFLNRPDLIRQVLVDDAQSFVKGRALRAGKRLLGEGLLTSEGADHLVRRRLIQPLFGKRRIRGYAPAVLEAADATASEWHDGQAIDLNGEMMRFALAVVARTIFAADVEREAPEIREVMDASMRVFHRFLLPGSELLWRLPLPATRRFNAARRDVDRFVFTTIDRRRSQPEHGDDVLALMLRAHRGTGDEPLGDRALRDESITMILAGHETTAQALTWTWHLLARNRHVEERLVAELERVLGGRAPGPDDADALPYTRAVFLETLRLYPPVWALARISTEPYELDGWRLDTGSTLIMSQWVVHRDSRWFPRAARFLPERWLEQPAPPPGAFFPFGGGPRLCIGERFAIAEAVLALATIAQRWQVVPHTPAPALDPRFALRPRGGLSATVRRRKNQRISTAATNAP